MFNTLVISFSYTPVRHNILTDVVCTSIELTVHLLNISDLVEFTTTRFYAYFRLGWVRFSKSKGVSLGDRNRALQDQITKRGLEIGEIYKKNHVMWGHRSKICVSLI